MIKESIVANGHGSLKPTLFAVHSTANPGATAANHASYWRNNPDYAVHLVSDWNECLHCVPYDSVCWQVGNGNATCEGIEICEATNRADFERGIEIAAQAVAERLKARGWSTDKMRTHKWFSENYGGSDHTDPIPYFNRWNYTWNEFTSLVAMYMGVSIDKEDDDMKPTIIGLNGDPTLYALDGGRVMKFDSESQLDTYKAFYRQRHGYDVPVFRWDDKDRFESFLRLHKEG